MLDKLTRQATTCLGQLQPGSEASWPCRPWVEVIFWVGGFHPYTAMPPSVKVTAPFRKLIQQLASAFYSGDCPPKTPEELAIAAQPKNSKAKVCRLPTRHGTFVWH